MAALQEEKDKVRGGEPRGIRVGMVERRPHQEGYSQKNLKTKVLSRSYDKFRRRFKSLQEPEILYAIRSLS